jgi:hypothetical protein
VQAGSRLSTAPATGHCPCLNLQAATTSPAGPGAAAKFGANFLNFQDFNMSTEPTATTN